MRSKYSAVIAGAGPAGLSASLGLARLGFQVEVFEKRKEWSSRVCGSFLSPEGSVHLKWLGLFDEVKKWSVPSQKVSLHALGRTAQMQIGQSGFPGMAIPRKDLEELLLDRARSERVQVYFGNEIVQKPDCDLFVAAGGRFSAFREERAIPKKGWTAFNIEYRDCEQKPGDLSLHFFPKAYVGSLTFSNGITNVSGVVHSDLRDKFSGGWEEILYWMRDQDSDLEGLLRRSSKASPVRGIPVLPFGAQFKTDQDYFSIGDNAAVCEPFMGEGISRALSSGPLMYQSLKNSLGRKEWQKAGWNDFVLAWNRAYAWRLRIGNILRASLGRKIGLYCFYQTLAGSSLIQSLFLHQIHHGSAWTEAH